jgi:hypothetical protein
MAMYKLHYGTQAAYDAKLAAQTLIEDDLYFTSDTCLIYKGRKQLSAAVEAVDEFPATGAQGRIYVKAETLNYYQLKDALTNLIPSITDFFDNVLVMDKDEAIKNNRVNLLTQVKDKFAIIADFSKIVF